MLLRLAAACALAAAAGAGCSDDAQSCVIGDRTQELEIVAVHWPAGGAIEDLVDGGAIDLVRPIQGGKVVYVGVRARNVDGCNLQLMAALRDPSPSQVIIALEQRPVRLVAGADGWGHAESTFDHLANVPACPSASALFDVDRAPWKLELRLEEPGGRSASTELIVNPRCAIAIEREECECECDSEFVLGRPCPGDTIDAGVE